MVADLERQNPGEAFYVYRAPGTAIAAFYDILDASGGHDVLFLEDDIITARNFIRYAAAWPQPHVTSFFHPRRAGMVPVPPRDFLFAQAVKIPAVVGALMLTAPRFAHTGGHDDEIGHALTLLNEKVIYHPTLVQHVGEVSLAWGPNRTLADRVSDSFPGEAFDCLSLLSRSSP